MRVCLTKCKPDLMFTEAESTLDLVSFQVDSNKLNVDYGIPLLSHHWRRQLVPLAHP